VFRSFIISPNQSFVCFASRAERCHSPTSAHFAIEQTENAAPQSNFIWRFIGLLSPSINHSIVYPPSDW
jgi:hypothetical protein